MAKTRTSKPRAVIAGRMYIMAQYARGVTLPVFREQMKRADLPYRATLKKIRHALVREDSRVDTQVKVRLQDTLSRNEALNTVYDFRGRLQALWGRTHESHEKVLLALQEWCRQAEATGVEVLQDFARRLQGYSLRTG